MPIDDEHNKTAIVGHFTDSRARMDGAVKALDVDGILYADRFPQQSRQVLSGEKLLSIEASGQKATCTVCGSTFKSEQTYCAHLKSRLLDRVAERVLEGLTASGGAITTHPAGTDTKFDENHLELMASIWGQGGVDQALPTEEDLEILSFDTEAEYALYRVSPAKFHELIAAKISYQKRKGLGDSKFAVIQRTKDASGKTIVRRRFPIGHLQSGARRPGAVVQRAGYVFCGKRPSETKSECEAQLQRVHDRRPQGEPGSR